MYMSANILKPTPGTHVKSENFPENYICYKLIIYHANWRLI